VPPFTQKMSQIRQPDGLTSEIPMPSTMLLRSRAAVAVLVIAALALTVGAATEPTWLQTIDQSLSESIRGWGEHGFFRVVTNLGSIFTALVVTIALAVLLWKRCRPMALAFPAVVIAAAAVDIALKLIVGRERPLGTLVGTNLGSYPSGHVITTVVLLGLLVPALWILTTNRAVLWTSIGLLAGGVTLVVLSRVNLGAHWPSDVLGSVLIGAAVLLGAEYALASEWACNRCGGCGLHLPRDKGVEQ